MKVRELVDILLQHDQDCECAIDVDDGIKGNYKLINGVNIVTPIIGDPFIAINADFSEENKHFHVRG